MTRVKQIKTYLDKNCIAVSNGPGFKMRKRAIRSWSMLLRIEWQIQSYSDLDKVGGMVKDVWVENVRSSARKGKEKCRANTGQWMSSHRQCECRTCECRMWMNFNTIMDASTEDLGWECDHHLDNPCVIFVLQTEPKTRYSVAGIDDLEWLSLSQHRIRMTIVCT